MKPHVLAFYSYRGGVGRSTALCNVAARMATDGDRVLVIDLDIQAPGASIILGGADYATPKVHGIVDELLAAKAENRPPDFESHSIRQMLLNGKPFWLLPAGRLDSGYPGRADQSEISYGSKDDEPSVRAMILALSACTQSEKFHYVLIDCRPGLSKASLFAIQNLAESVVVLFGLDRQSLHGVGWTREKFAEMNKLVHLVASRTPARDDTREALKQASEAWEVPVQVTLTFDESMLLRERIVFSSEKSQLARDFDTLTSVVRSPDDIATLVLDGRRLLGESGGALPAHARFSRAHSIDKRDVRPLAALAHYFTVTKEYEQAVKYLRLAVDADSEFGELWQAADALARQPLDSNVQESLEAVYARIPVNKESGAPLVARLAQFSSRIREAIKPGADFNREVADAFLFASEAALQNEEAWNELLRRIPLPDDGGEARQFIVSLLSVCNSDPRLSEAAANLDRFLAERSKDIAGMVTRFGHDGYGFLATDDGQNDIYFRRENCAGWGREPYEYISIGETALFDLVYGDDKRWRAENVRFPSTDSDLSRQAVGERRH